MLLDSAEKSIECLVEGVKTICPEAASIVEMGSHNSQYITGIKTGNIQFSANKNCAAGTGSFFEDQMTRLGGRIEDYSDYVVKATSIPRIAGRCSVFAKTDIQPLINEGATREDLAASIFQAVVNQTISGLACGKPIRGHVAFLGGPLHFLPELKNAFIRTLKLDDEHIMNAENSHLFAAIGSALCTEGEKTVSLKDMCGKLSVPIKMEFEVARMEPLFANDEEYKEFNERHEKACVEKGDISKANGPLFMGIDAGSTTTKIALVDKAGRLVYSFYSSNDGSPLKTSIRSITEIKERLPEGAHIARSCSTGYGEALLKSAFLLDDGEVETVAHYYAAAFFDEGVDCILDIGGQDMKCIKIKDGTVDSVQLNEACSSGCGSFIETFIYGYCLSSFKSILYLGRCFFMSVHSSASASVSESVTMYSKLV